MKQVSLLGGRYWDRTSDLFRVREARYRCANRPEVTLELVVLNYRSFVSFCEVETGFEPVWTALQAAASPLGHATIVGSPPVLPKLACSVSLERMTRFELATLTLAR